MIELLLGEHTFKKIKYANLLSSSNAPWKACTKSMYASNGSHLKHQNTTKKRGDKRKIIFYLSGNVMKEKSQLKGHTYSLGNIQINPNLNN